MNPHLMAISGPLKGQLQPLAGRPVTIGRSRESDMLLPDTAASRAHCTVRPHEDGYELVDLESRNGTFVNGVPVTHRLLRHGDAIRIGGSDFLFLLHDVLPPTPSQILNEEPISSTTWAMPIGPQMVAAPFAMDVGGMARDLVALFRIGNVINAIREVDLLQRELLRLICEVVPADTGAIVLLPTTEEDAPSICAWHRDSGDESSIDVRQELVQRAAWEQSAIMTNPTGSSAGQPNVLCLPLIGIERTIGVIYLTSGLSSGQQPFGEDHVHFLTPVSRIAAVTLENILALDALRQENRRLKEALDPAGKLIGESRQIGQVEDFIARVALSDSSVLIRGESGTGKELVARAIHNSGPRATRPFVAINCAAIPDTLLESELFGNEKGAFTGAVATRKGKLEAAEDGTLFLDEIGEMPPLLQAKLLRVLQQREFERLGSTRPIALRARVLAATNKNLGQAIKTGDFRQDLYYRLNVVSVTVPPLREHRDDIPLLALYFAAKYAARNKRPFKGISREARALLMNYSWPGNVRELENAIEHAIVLGLTEEILREDLPTSLLEEQSAELTGARYHDALNQTKRELVLTALQEAKGSFPEAAALLGIHPKYLHRLVRNLNLRQNLRDQSS
jgi:transcriptional regulator with GAF, ATPase, and Fis domain